VSAAVITGASSGIGRECTKILLEKKLFKSKIDKIYLLARRKEVLDDFANKYADGIESKTIR
jgi:short-subunit dehydrogenase